MYRAIVILLFLVEVFFPWGSLADTPTAEQPTTMVLDVFMGKEHADWPLSIWEVEKTTTVTEVTSEGGRRAKKIDFNGFAVVYFQNPSIRDLSSFLPTGELVFDFKILERVPYMIEFRIDCVHPCVGQYFLRDLPPLETWQEIRLPLAKFAQSGTDFKRVNTPFLVTGPPDAKLSVMVANVRWEKEVMASGNEIAKRQAQAILEQMTLDEKIGQMTMIERQVAEKDGNAISKFNLGALLSGGGSAPAPNTPEAWADMVDGFQKQALSGRLKIPLLYGVDAVHGHNNVVGATIFPHNLGLGATRNAKLVEQIGKATAIEVAATGANWTFSPCLCVVRDDRWGRGYESFGETPELVSLMTTLITGYQGTHESTDSQVLLQPETILATAKHWVGDGGTTLGTDQGNTDLREQELRDIHVFPYVKAIERRVGSIMVSHSSFQQQRMHGHYYLNNQVLKNELGFDGLIVSDWEGVNKLPETTYGAQISRAINAGVDMVMVPHEAKKFQTALRLEILEGRIPLWRIDDAVLRILVKKFELNLFEKPFAHRQLLKYFGSTKHRQLARQAVRESLVLLKNQKTAQGTPFLPLPKNTKAIYVAGKNAHDLGNQSGGWTISWQGDSGNDHLMGTTILQGIQAAVSPETKITHSSNAHLPLTDHTLGIVVIGEKPYSEGVGDRSDLHLGAEDEAVISKVCGAIPCVVIVVSGRPLFLTDQLPSMPALIAAWLPGTEGGGVADVLFGDFNFKGKLPISWPRSMEQLPVNVGDPNYDPLFPYDFGLRY